MYIEGFATVNFGVGSGRRVDFLDKREKVARWSDRIVSSMNFPTFKNILSRSWQELPGQEILNLSGCRHGDLGEKSEAEIATVGPRVVPESTSRKR